MVEKHIKSLLYDHDCVIIPDFGGLITRYVSARVLPVKHSLVPPSKKIAFNEKLTLNDGLLISTIAYHNGIDKEDARKLVADFVFRSKQVLEKENRLEMQDIGIFRYNAERNLEFEYVEGDNLLEDSFGLPELIARPVKLEDPALLRTLLKERQQVPVYTKLPLRKRLRRAVNVTASLLIGGLTVSALYLLSLQTDYNLSSLNPLALFGSGYQPQTSETVEAVTDWEKLYTEEDLAGAVSDSAYDVTAHTDSFAVAVETYQLSAEQTVAAESKATVQDAEPAIKEEVKANTAPPKEEKKEVNPLLVKERTGRFYIITGGYSRLENAEVARTAVKKGGHEAKVLLPLPGSRLFRVSVADFATEEDAKASLATYRKTFGETIWVLNN
ncbi:SPOR domain-containing protein [Pontibacter sp. SGAir0037]|uniref:HU domain-containing protein n=1 Tax=Pontibacter sp. SGAir0037 TaxID=2571030 RepID=UPI0010CD081A|nr:SPOR domain-containing protein [Pontibacter sp. SGAir0037]QCR21855.1 sporulation protein [Pontibacter sp. SGAir0037]